MTDAGDAGDVQSGRTTAIVASPSFITNEVPISIYKHFTYPPDENIHFPVFRVGSLWLGIEIQCV